MIYNTTLVEFLRDEAAGPRELYLRVALRVSLTKVARSSSTVMSRDSPRRGNDSPFRGSTRSNRRNSFDEHTEAVSRMLVQRDREYWQQQDEETERLQERLATDLEASIQRHEAVRQYAIQALENTKLELARIEHERIQRVHAQQAAEIEDARRREAEVRLREQEAAAQALEEERRIADLLGL